MKKGVWLVILCVVMVLFVSTAMALSQQENEEWRYTFDDECVFLDRYLGNEKIVEVPQVINDRPVRGMYGAFADLDVEQVIIPKTIDYQDFYIGLGAFANCKNLQTVEILCGYVRIEDAAFLNCEKLEQVNFNGTGYAYIKGTPFWGCHALTRLELPSVHLAGKTFLNCGLTELVIHNTSDDGIGGSACLSGLLENQVHFDFPVEFSKYGVNGELTIDRENGMAWVMNANADGEMRTYLLWADMDEQALDQWERDWVENTYIYNSVYTIDLSEQLNLAKTHSVNGDFEYGLRRDGTVQIIRYCGADPDVVFPDQVNGIPVTTIGSYAFDSNGCFGRKVDIRTVVVPDSVLALEPHALHGSEESILKVELPVGLQKCGRGAVNRIGPVCVKIPEAAWNADGDKVGRPIMHEYGFYEYYHYDENSLTVFLGRSTNVPDGMTVLEIPRTIDGLPVVCVNGKFPGVNYGKNKNIINITEVVLPDTIVEIGTEAFYGMTNLTTINIPAQLRTIGDNAFSGCKELKMKASDLPGTLRRVGAGALGGIGLSGSLVIKAGCVYGEGAFSGTEITEVIVEPGVAEIPAGMFSGCKELKMKASDLPGTLKRVGAGAFSNTGLSGSLVIKADCVYGEGAFRSTEITEVIVEPGVTEIPGKMFYNCEKLKKLTLNEGLKTIGEEAFVYCNFTTVTLPSTLEALGRWAFAWCYQLKIKGNVLPSSLKYMGDGCFYDCKNVQIKADTLPESLEWIGESVWGNEGKNCLTGSLTMRSNCEYSEGAFLGCGITEVKMEAGIKMVPGRLFQGCKQLKKITFNEDLEIIGADAFRGTGITKLTIPSSIKELGEGCFSGYDHAIVQIDMTQNPTVKLSGDGPFNDIYNKQSTITIAPGSTAETFFKKHRPSNAAVKVVVPKEVHTAPADPVLKAGTYKDTDIIYHLVIPEGVEEIEDGAFQNIRSLCDVKFPSTLKKIGKKAFAGCISLDGVTFPKNLVEIDNGAFADCWSLSKVTFNQGLTTLGEEVFSLCYRLETVQLPKSLTSMGKGCFAQCSGMTAVTLPVGLTVIPNGAFYNCSSLKTLTIPEGVETIELSAFGRCIRLTSVKLPKSLKTIGDGAFMTNCSLKQITFPAGLEKIGGYAFEIEVEYYADTLQKKTKYGFTEAVSIPASVTEIGDMAFGGQCMTTVNFAKGSQLTQLGNGAFMTCDFMTKLNLTNCSMLTSIGESAFSHNVALTSLVFPANDITFGQDVLNYANPKLTVTAPKGSAAEAWMLENYPDIKLKNK